MENAETFALLLFALLLLSVFWWYRSLQRFRLIVDTPTHAIRSAPQGYVELVGKAAGLPDTPINAQLTRESCVWFRYRIERKDMSNGRIQWKLEASGSSDQNFVLDDGTGHCIIDPLDAEIVPTIREVWHTSEGNGQELRHTEERIHAGETIYGLGFFQSFAPPSFDAEHNSLTSEILAEWKRDHEWLLLHFDRDRNGEIDVVEWEVARQQAAESARYQLNRSYDHSVYHVLSKSPNRGQQLLIATRPPDKMARYYQIQSLVALAVAALILGTLVFSVLPKTAWLT